MSKKKESNKEKAEAREVEAELVLDDSESTAADSPAPTDLPPEEIKKLSPEVLLDDEDLEEKSEDLPMVFTEEPEETKGLATSDPMAQYVREVQRYPLLTKEQEYELAVRYRETGDQEAAEKLVTSNLRFVIKVAAEYAKYGSKLIDVVQEGNVGLMHAVREFNPYKGNRLITYAVWWIRGYIKEYLMRQQSMVRIGTNAKQKKLFHSLRREERKLELMGKEPDVKLLASRLEVPEKDVVQMQQRIRFGDMSLDQNVDAEGRTQWIDMQVDPDEELQDEALARQEMLNMILEKIVEIKESLNEKEIYILQHRIMEDEPMTLQEIGDHFGISRERARQLEARVLKRLKEKVQSQFHSETED